MQGLLRALYRDLDLDLGTWRGKECMWWKRFSSWNAYIIYIKLRGSTNWDFKKIYICLKGCVNI